MNKYVEAFNKSVETGFVSESEYSIIKEAIEKAEKYDEVMKIENSLNGGSIRSGKKPYALQILIERDEALKRCEELEKELDVKCGTCNKSQMYDTYKKLYLELSEKYHTQEQDICNTVIKKINDLEKKNKVLVEGVRALFDNHIKYEFEYTESSTPLVLSSWNWIHFSISKEWCDDTLDDIGTKPNEAYTKIKAMLELVEVENDTGTDNK